MHGTPTELAQRVPPTALLGYLNLSDGRPDPRFERSLNQAFAILLESGDPAPWQTIPSWLIAECDALAASDSAAFRNTDQARAVIDTAMRKLLTAYRHHHVDLLAHQPDGMLFTPLFLARCCEAVLRLGPPWDQPDRLLAGALTHLNDFVGHRPIAILEPRPQTDYYPREKVRPIPLHISGVGAGAGRYHDLIEAAFNQLSILEAADSALLEEACFQPDLLDELALDPRAYDHQHPVNRRPNYLFGEWDPHHIDEQGRFRRFVLRQPTLDSLLAWVPVEGTESVRQERLIEAASVLAGTILMAAGVSGSGPEFHDSSVTLSTLVPGIARYRDRFYRSLLGQMTGPHGDRLRVEAERLRQPFAGVRQHLNRALSDQRAHQLIHRRLALVFAELNQPEKARRQARAIPAPSLRMITEIHIQQTACRQALRENNPDHAVELLTEVEELIHRGIDCGALPDPWNVLGYQGLFPLFRAREDSVRDLRHEELIDVIDRQFELYGQLTSTMTVGATSSEGAEESLRRMHELAGWWDVFATATVSEVPRVHGGERAEAAEHVAKSLALWQARPEGRDEVTFWRDHRDGFRSPSAYGPVIAALLDHQEWKAAMALLLAWLSDADSVALFEGTDSFGDLSRRWIGEVLRLPPEERRDKIGTLDRFFQLIEVSAEDRWQAPVLPSDVSRDEDDEDDENDDLYRAAYEDVSYRDSTDDGEGSIIGGDDGPERAVFPLEGLADDFEQHLELIHAMADLWQMVADDQSATVTENPDCFARWRDAAAIQRKGLVEFCKALAAVPIPAPAGGFEDVIESDQRLHLKAEILNAAIDAAVALGRAVRTLTALAGQDGSGPDPNFFDWELPAVHLERALAAGDRVRAAEQLRELWPELRAEPLLFVPLSAGGSANAILRARSAQALLASLLERLPRLGMFRESYQLLKLARDMEQNPVQGRKRISEFDRLFDPSVTAVAESLLNATDQWATSGQLDGSNRPAVLNELLRRVVTSYRSLWMEHSRGLRLSVLESIDENAWEGIVRFIREYGGELFTPQYLSLANVHGLLHRGIDTHIDALIEQADPVRPMRLVVDLENGTITRPIVGQVLEMILTALSENYEIYSDYNSTTVQSDYGENLYQLLALLRLKVRYDRQAWQLRPTMLAHQVLCRQGRDELADGWYRWLSELTAPAAGQLLEELADLERETGMRIRSIRERLEERFVQPMLMDRLVASVEPALKDSDPEAFNRFERLLEPFATQTVGSGLDLPGWLRLIEEEIEELRAIEGSPGIDWPDVPVSFSEFREQLDRWDEAPG